MEREQLIRDDFPLAQGERGFDRRSVSAHLEAVAAEVAALEARITALEVERDAFRRQATLGGSGEPQAGLNPVPFTPTGPPPAPKARVDVLPGNGHRAGSRFGRITRRNAPDSEPQSAGRPPAGHGDDEVAARLTASTLALEGADREAIRERLEAEYRLRDPEGLVDEVLSHLA